LRLSLSSYETFNALLIFKIKTKIKENMILNNASIFSHVISQIKVLFRYKKI
jgi:hypothetical protein